LLLLGDAVWNGNGEGIDEEDSPCDTIPLIAFNYWVVIRGGDGPRVLG